MDHTNHSCFGLHRFPPAPSTVRVTVPRCRLCRVSAEHVEYWTSTLYFLACHRTTRCRHCSPRSHSTRTRGIHDDGRIESLCYITTLTIQRVSYTRLSLKRCNAKNEPTHHDSTRIEAVEHTAGFAKSGRDPTLGGGDSINPGIRGSYAPRGSSVRCSPLECWRSPASRRSFLDATERR